MKAFPIHYYSVTTALVFCLQRAFAPLRVELCCFFFFFTIRMYKIYLFEMRKGWQLRFKVVFWSR